jgi:hypothetical protein
MVDADCGVHLMIDSAMAQTNQYGTSVVAKFSILAATDPAQVGKTIQQFLEVEGDAVDKLYNLAEAIGRITREQRVAAAQQGVGMDFPEEPDGQLIGFKGQQTCGQIKMVKKQRKNLATGQYEDDPEHPNPYPQLGFRYFAVTSPRAADVPKDAAMLQAAGIKIPTGPVQAAKPAQKPTTAPPQPPAQGQLPLTGPTTPADMAW